MQFSATGSAIIFTHIFGFSYIDMTINYAFGLDFWLGIMFIYIFLLLHYNNLRKSIGPLLFCIQNKVQKWMAEANTYVTYEQLKPYKYDFLDELRQTYITVILLFKHKVRGTQK